MSARPGKVGDGVFVLRDQLRLLCGQPSPRNGDHPQPLGRQLTHGVVDVRPDVVARGQNDFGCALTVSSSPNTDAENDRPDRNGRCASASAVGFEPLTDCAALDDRAVGRVHLPVRRWRPVRRAPRSAKTSSRE